jgi:hypothetical protein
MDATKDISRDAFAFDAGAVQESLAKAAAIPKKMLEANLKAGSTMLSFASRRMQAQAEFLGRFARCANLEEAAAMQKDYFEALVGDCSRELNVLMEIARENSALLTPSSPVAPPAGKKA